MAISRILGLVVFLVLSASNAPDARAATTPEFICPPKTASFDPSAAQPPKTEPPALPPEEVVARVPKTEVEPRGPTGTEPELINPVVEPGTLSHITPPAPDGAKSEPKKPEKKPDEALQLAANDWAKTTFGASDVTTLGVGGFAKVFEVTDSKSGQKKVVKVPLYEPGQLVTEGVIQRSMAVKEANMDPTTRKRRYILDVEAREVELPDGRKMTVLVTEHFPRSATDARGARTLYEYLKDETLTEAQRLALAGQLSEAVERVNYLHSIHGDISLENFLVDDAGNVKIIDLGNATQRGGAVRSRGAEPSTGTFGYMTRNALENKRLDETDDGASLREVLKDVLHGRSRFDPRNPHVAAVPWNPKENKSVPILKQAAADGADPIIALVGALRSPKRARDRLDLIDEVNEFLAQEAKVADPAKKKILREAFYLSLGGRLRLAPIEKLTRLDGKPGTIYTNEGAAADVLSSPELVARFPDGLGFTERTTEATIIGALRQKRAADRYLKSLPKPKSEDIIRVGTGQIDPYANYDLFLKRLEELRANPKPGQFAPKPAQYYDDIVANTYE